MKQDGRSTVTLSIWTTAAKDKLKLATAGPQAKSSTSDKSEPGDVASVTTETDIRRDSTSSKPAGSTAKAEVKTPSLKRLRLAGSLEPKENNQKKSNEECSAVNPPILNI